ncbi:MAG: NAD(P)H-hydrate dehydratase [Alphaproteobacteria bacterium]|nr:MAG: NAD(P)H-hydrate dehydratase [Alphaproteobacteria bacterium]
MFEVLTAEEMKQADAAAIAGGVPGIRLMEQAGTAVARQIQDRFQPVPALVLCGPGNNGGDGFIAAAQLKKAGWQVRLACLVKKSELKGDAALAAKQWDGEIESLNSNLSLKDTGLVVVAIFGTGLARALDPELVTLFDKIRAKKIPVTAVDLPTGLDATTGAIAPGTLPADLTVTFTRKKLAHVLLPGKAICGRIQVAVIGISDQTVAGLKAAVFENDPALWLKDFPIPRMDSHKYDRGHAVIYGGEYRIGAACLAAAGAQKIGAGLVTIASRHPSLQTYQAYRASIMVDAWHEREEFKSILRDERRNVVIAGPGAGADDNLRESVEDIFAFNKSAVFDADVFTLFRDNPKDFFAKLSPSKHVLTPHEGEFARIFGQIEGHKAERVRKAAKLSNAVVLLKGSDTIIAVPDGTAVINTNAPSTLATAGSGDVLTGFIGGLMAQGMPPFMAACAGAWLHGETARSYGLGLTAEDIISQLSQSLNRLFRTPVSNS